jgi:hypothetical protein
MTMRGTSKNSRFRRFPPYVSGVGGSSARTERSVVPDRSRGDGFGSPRGFFPHGAARLSAWPTDCGFGGPVPNGNLVTFSHHAGAIRIPGDDVPLSPPKRAVSIVWRSRASYAIGQEDAMTRAPLYLIAGLTALTMTMGVDASAQDCPEWLKWLCSGGPSPNAVASQGSLRDKELAQTKPTSSSATSRKSNKAKPAVAGAAKPQQMQDLDTARPARPEAAMSDGEKEMLFQEFLEWSKARRANAETNR